MIASLFSNKKITPRIWSDHWKWRRFFVIIFFCATWRICCIGLPPPYTTLLLTPNPNASPQKSLLFLCNCIIIFFFFHLITKVNAINLNESNKLMIWGRRCYGTNENIAPSVTWLQTGRYSQVAAEWSLWGGRTCPFGLLIRIKLMDLYESFAVECTV